MIFWTFTILTLNLNEMIMFNLIEDDFSICNILKMQYILLH